jgi:hypothetical protein
MHDRLTELLGEEVVGEVTRVGDVLFDVGLGRICLPVLQRERAEELLARLRESLLGRELRVLDQLHLTERSEPVRGLLEVTIKGEGGAPYLLQITSRQVLSFYERRFLLEPELGADLRGLLVDGLLRIMAGGETPLRLLSGFDRLRGRYLECLDAVVRAAQRGQALEASTFIEELLPVLRTTWRLLPWPLRETVQPVSRVGRERLAPHDRQLRRTLLVATNVRDGKTVYQYVHQHHPLEEYDQVVAWMTEVLQAMVESYPAPAHASAMARASSVELFLGCFPGMQRLVGPAPVQT